MSTDIPSPVSSAAEPTPRTELAALHADIAATGGVILDGLTGRPAVAAQASDLNPSGPSTRTGAQIRAVADACIAARRRRARARRRAIGLAALVVTAAVTLPAVADTHLVSVASTAAVFAVLAVSVHLLVGVCGLPSFGQPAYLGVGAYTAAQLAGHGVADGGIQLAAATAAGALTAAVTAPLVLRTRATTFLLATFALQHLAATLAAQWTTATGGDEGFHTPPITLAGIPVTGPPHVYWYALAVLVLAAGALALLLGSRRGLVWRGCAGHEPRMAALGYHVNAEFAVAYTLAGALAGAAGALLVAVHRYVSPADLGFDVAALSLLAAAIGAGSLAITIASAVVVVVARDVVGPATEGHTLAVLGALFLAAAYGRAALHRRRSAPAPGASPARRTGSGRPGEVID